MKTKQPEAAAKLYTDVGHTVCVCVLTEGSDRT